MRRATLATGLLLSACAGEPEPWTCPAPPPDACTASSTPDLAVVSVQRVESPLAGALVLTHRDDGSVIARGHTDAQGCAQIASEPGALLTVAGPDAGAPKVTTTAPAAGRRTVHLPALADSECVTALRIDVQNPRPLGERDRAVRFSATGGCDRWGCVDALSTSRSFEVAVPAHILGGDGLVQLWIRECIDSIDQLQNFVTTCRETLALAPPSGSIEVTLGPPLGGFTAAGGNVEVDGQIFPARVEEERVQTIIGLPFDHATRISVALPTSSGREILQRWGDGVSRPPEPALEEYLPSFPGGARLDGARTLHLPVPPYAADSIVTRFDFGGAWSVILPPGRTPITMPEDAELPVVAPQALPAHIVDDDDQPDHEGVVAGGIFIVRIPNSGTFLDVPVVRRLRTTYSYPPE